MNRNKTIAISVIIMAILLFSGCVEKIINQENTVTVTENTVTVTLIENEEYEISPDTSVYDTYYIVISGHTNSVGYSENYEEYTPSSIILTTRRYNEPKIIDQKELNIGEEMRVTSDGNKSIIVKDIYLGIVKGEKRVMANVIIRENP